MIITRITVSVIVALSVASAVYAQEALKGEVVTVDKASRKISIKLSGTVGSSDATAPTRFKVQDARMFNILKPLNGAFPRGSYIRYWPLADVPPRTYESLIWR
jgi:hypothetical protein